MEKQQDDGGKNWALCFDMMAREHGPAIMFIIHGILCSASKFHCWGGKRQQQRVVEESKGGKRDAVEREEEPRKREDDSDM